MFEGHHGPITGLHCHTALGPLDFSHLFVTSSFDWTVKLWSTKVADLTCTFFPPFFFQFSLVIENNLLLFKGFLMFE